jgi:hypothetical protein
MFGGLVFLVGGSMSVAAGAQGSLVVRVIADSSGEPAAFGVACVCSWLRAVLGRIEGFQRRRRAMILSTVKIEDFDRFWNAFSTKGAEKRTQHGSKGSHVFRDPNDDNRVWIVFDWDEEGYNNLLSDPDMPAIFQEAGLQGRPEKAEPAGEHDA